MIKFNLKFNFNLNLILEAKRPGAKRLGRGMVKGRDVLLPRVLPCPTILLRINWWIQLKELSKGKALFILHAMIGMLSSHLMQSEIIIYGLVRKCVKLSPFS